MRFHEEWSTSMQVIFRRGAKVRADLNKQHEELRAVLGAFGLVKWPGTCRALAPTNS